MNRDRHFNLTVNTEEYELAPERYLITEENKVHRMGNVVLDLPVNAARMPFQPQLSGAEYVQFRCERYGHSLVYCRLDATDETLEFTALINAFTEQQHRQAAKETHVAMILQPVGGEYELVRNSIASGSGCLYYIKTENMLKMPFRVRYQAVFVIDENDFAPILYFEHVVSSEQPFGSTGLESSVVKGLSDIIYKTVNTVKVEASLDFSK